jgi:hypothetical protein
MMQQTARGVESIHDELSLYRLESDKNMGDGEESFNMQVPLPPQLFPDGPRRPPKFFNRVRMGYDWNKYNQMHFDSDNPPPKVVQAYKFNIFYPDLADKSRIPGYQLIPDGDEHLILRFKAGAPYEDVAFRIINREWERGQRDGFKCSFERGVLHLWFQLKRFRYRR